MSESSQKNIYEPCPECNTGKMIHSKLYVYECDTCGYKYRIKPAAKKKDTIELLQKSILEVKK